MSGYLWRSRAKQAFKQQCNCWISWNTVSSVIFSFSHYGAINDSLRPCPSWLNGSCPFWVHGQTLLSGIAEKRTEKSRLYFAWVCGHESSMEAGVFMFCKAEAIVYVSTALSCIKQPCLCGAGGKAKKAPEVLPVFEWFCIKRLKVEDWQWTVTIQIPTNF